MIEEQIQTMMNQKVIEPANSRYGSNIVLVKNPKSDDWRFTINLKSVNKNVIADCYPVSSHKAAILHLRYNSLIVC